MPGFSRDAELRIGLLTATPASSLPLGHDVRVPGNLLPAALLVHPDRSDTKVLVRPAFGIFPPHKTVSRPARTTVSP